MNSDMNCENSSSYDGDTISWPSVHNDIPVINLETTVLLDHPSREYAEIELSPDRSVVIPCYFDGDTTVSSVCSGEIPVTTAETTLICDDLIPNDGKIILSPDRPTFVLCFFAIAILAVALLALIICMFFAFFT